MNELTATMGDLLSNQREEVAQLKRQLPDGAFGPRFRRVASQVQEFGSRMLENRAVRRYAPVGMAAVVLLAAGVAYSRRA